jgi:hypothetical protein
VLPTVTAIVLGAQHLTPITDHFERGGLIAGSGAVLGAMGGLLLAVASRPIAALEVSLLGVFSLELDVPKIDYGAGIAVMGAVGSIAILAMKGLEYYGAF